MDWFFDQWLYKMGHPVFEVTKNYSNGKLTLNVKQTQKIDVFNEYPQVEYFQTKVDIEIDGKIEQVWIKPQAENVFTFDTQTEPKLVNFDYEGTLIKELKFEKSTDELIYQMANDKDVLGRRWASGELPPKSPGSSRGSEAALRDAAVNDPAWQIRNAALLQIGSLPGAPLLQPQGVRTEAVGIHELLFKCS